MRLVTYSTAPGAPARLGVRVGHRILDVESASRVDGEPLPNSMKALLREGRGKLARVQALAKAAQAQAGRFSAAMHEERAIRFLPPVVDAERLVCVAENHRAHHDDLQRAGLAGEMPPNPVAVVKPATALVGHNARLAKPAAAGRLDYEPQLVFVVGRRARSVASDDAMDHVIGVTLLAELVDRDARPRDAAAGETPAFGALGPEIVTMDEIRDPDDVWITCSVNGMERLRMNTGEQVWNMGELLESFSRDTAFEPGDMLSTGAPGGVAVGKSQAQGLFLKLGDVVECSIEGLTTLRFTIAAG